MDLYEPLDHKSRRKMSISSGKVKRLAVETSAGCDSDFEIIDHSDGEMESNGYHRLQPKKESILEFIKAGVDTPEDVKSQHLEGLFKNGKSDKIVMSLSQEQIYLMRNQHSHGISSEVERSQDIKKQRSASFASAFSVVPIKIHENRGPASKPLLPEIVLTSFESSQDDQKDDDSDQSVRTVRSFSKDLGTSPRLSERKASYESQHSFSAEVAGLEGSLGAGAKPLDFTKSLPYRLSFDINSHHRPSDTGLSICEGDLNEVQHHDYHSSIPSDLRCRICDNVFKDPRTLNCLHSFCLQCLINENFGNDASIPFWSGPEGVQYEWKATSDTYPTSNSSSNQDSDSPTPLRSDSQSSTESSKKAERGLKSARKSLRSTSTAPSCAEVVAVQKVKTLVCPVCQYSTEIPLGGIIQLPQNYILVRKIEHHVLTVRENGIASVWCNLCCDSVTATHHCTTCTLNLCGFCKEAHGRQRSTAHHNINNILELRKHRQGTTYSHDGGDLNLHLKCSMHPGFELKLFCLTCQQLICSDCNILLHKGHKVDTMRKVYKSYQKVVKESIEKTKPLCEYANHSISKLAAISKKISEKCDHIQQEVELHMAAYFEALEVHRATLLQQISRARESKMQMILEQQYDLEKRSSEAKAVVEFSEELTTIGNDAELLSFVNVLIKRFEHCYKYKPLLDSKISDTLHFLPEVRAPSTKAQNNIPMYGIITTQTVEPSLCTLETEGYDQLRVHRKAELAILSRDSDGMPLCHGGLTIQAVLKYKDSSARNLPFQISDRRDGSYIISFIPDTTGTLVLSVTIKTKHIKGSPFTLRAKSMRPHSGIFHCCAFCSSKGSKSAVCACEGVMQGFKGCGHGHPGHPGRRHWSCCASLLENSECSTANKLL